MATRNQVTSQIRFGLGQLSAHNEQHDFEQMCRHLVRSRICSNILPATGPVSAGGDQGRDFETCATYLRATPIANSTFVGNVSQKPIAFTCSIQKKGIIHKIKSDIDTIMASGTPVEAIYYFCVTDITVSTRHKLQFWAKQKHSVSFELLDRQAIADLLSEREVFWIAQRFLNTPSEMYPRSSDEVEWYHQSIEFWKSKKKPRINFADF